jgi:hypothetical protein
MERSLLEKASWMAGIVSALIAVWLLISPADKDASKPPPINAVLPAAPTQLIESSRQSTNLKPIDLNPCPTVDSTEAAYKTAQALSTFAQRDAAYIGLVENALCRSHLDMAKKITDEISTFKGRDEQYQKIVVALIEAKDYAGAEKIIEKISTFSARDEARHKIIESARKKRIDGE